MIFSHRTQAGSGAGLDGNAMFRTQKGERIYAIGDIHGREDLFEQLLTLIRTDNADRAPSTAKIILLGDIIDRGPASASLMVRLHRYTKASDRFIVLKGNHEQLMVAALDGDIDALQAWLKLGGDATLKSWGMPDSMLESDEASLTFEMARPLIPERLLAWIGCLPLSHRSGDVLFVHAGIRPGVELSHQKSKDMLWIRDSFLSYRGLHPVLIVHGHSISESGPEILPNRIGIDTGAYRTGRLTALGLENDEQWILTT